MTILIHDTGVDGWCIEDRSSSSGGWLECHDKKSIAVKRARNKWAAPKQPIKVAGPNSHTVRKGDPNWEENLSSGNGSSGGLGDMLGF